MSKKLSYDELQRRVDELAEEGTKCRIAQEALRKSQEEYSTLVENSLTGIYIDQGERIVFANEKFAQIYGYGVEEVIGMDSRKLVHPEDRPLTNKRRKKRLLGKEPPTQYDARGLTKAGKTIWVRRRNTVIDYKGKPAILGNIVDITEHKQTQEELGKTNRELKNLVDIVSHELRNPVVGIQGFSTRLLKKYEKELNEKGRKYLGQIIESAARIEKLVSDLLTLSRAGRVAPEFEDASCSEIVSNVVKGLQHRFEKRDINIVMAKALPTLSCDKQGLSQIFENLIVNAVKYTHGSKNPRVEIGYNDRGDFHEFYVKDNGIGIDPKDQQKIFDMFARSKETKNEEGTGLGLAIVERIVKNHGGRVWVESKKGKGATFYFTLPK